MPAEESASRSRRAVATDTSSSSASLAAVSRPRACMSSRAATSRSARTFQYLQKSAQLMSTFATTMVPSTSLRGEPPVLRGLSTVSFFADDVPAAQAWYTQLLGFEPYFARPIGGAPAYVE